MKNDKTAKPTDDAMKNYNAKDRDFQRTEDEVDNVSKPENESGGRKKKEPIKQHEKEK